METNFKTGIKNLQEKIELKKNNVETEESTKMAFILPFIQLLGYDVFSPHEVIAEYTADTGVKKGEKVDYAIMIDGKPVIIIECKSWTENLEIHTSQLLRYFHCTESKFAILTNGIDYQIYSDLEESNKMDEKPFLTFNILNVTESQLKEILKFHKSVFSIDEISDVAINLKYTSEIKKVFTSEISEPSEELVKFFISKVYKKRATSSILEWFKDLVKDSMTQIFREEVNLRLKSALKKEEEEIKKEEIKKEEESKENDGVVTTEKELEGFRIVTAILRRKIKKDRIIGRDTKSYFGILLDDNNRKPLCRLHFNSDNVKYIEVFDSNREGKKIKINSVDDIYDYEDELLKICNFYESN